MSRRPNSSDTRINYALALAEAGDRAAGRAELQKLAASDKNVVFEGEARALFLEGR
jgi:hypothetical protein